MAHGLFDSQTPDSRAVELGDLEQHLPSSRAWVQWGILIAGMAAALIGGLMLAAWLSGAAARWSAAGAMVLKTNMALGQVLAGASLILLGLCPQRRPYRWAGLAAAAIIFLLGSLTLSEHLIGRDLGIDQLLATEPAGAVAGGPNRMGPPGSTSLALLGMAFLLVGTAWRRVVPYLGLGVVLLNLIPTVGYLYGISNFYAKPGVTDVSWPTVFAMIGLGLGLVLACPEGLMAPLLRDDSGGKMLRGLLPVALLLPLGLGFLRMLGQSRGLYDSAMGTGLFALAMMLVFSLMIWRSAGRLSRADGERKRAEESLRLSEERFRTAFEDGAIPMALTGMGGELLKVNSAFCQMLGYASAEVVGRNFAEFTHPDDLGENRAGIQRLASGEAAAFQMERRYVRKDGSIIYCELSTSFVRDVQGQPLQLVTPLQDITDRKKKEEDLRKLNRTLRALSNSDQAVMRAVDESQYLQDVCAIIVRDCGHVMAWVGYALQDEGKTVEPMAHAGIERDYLRTARITWADTARGRGPTGTAIRTGRVSICNNMLSDARFGPWRQEASKRGFASSIALPLSADGKTFGALTIYSDKPAPFGDEELPLLSELAGELAHGISSIRLREAHSQMTEALRESERRERERARVLATILDAVPTPVIIAHDPKGVHMSGNRAADELLRNPRGGEASLSAQDETRPRHFRAVKDGRELGLDELPAQRAARGENVRDFEFTLAFNDGSARHVLGYGTPLLDEQGRVRGAVHVLVDITERKRAEQDLEAAKLAAERARATAEEASRAKDKFIAVLSHELRTPLTPALAAVSMMEADMRLPGETRENLALVRRNIALEVRLIADLMDVSRIISGKLHLEKRPMDVMVAIREAARIVSGDLDAKGQTLSIETPGSAYLTSGDAARLQQVFWNLLRNANKFAPHRGRIAIRASVVPVDHCPLAATAPACPVGMGDCPLPQASDGNGQPCGGNLIIEVSDNGSGIAPDVLPRLFNAFEQGQEARTFGGLGLGLSICKAVVEMHGGTIAAQSDGPGKGAAFTVRLPIAQCPMAAASDGSPAAADDTHATDGDGQHASTEQPRVIRVLLVEDHPDTAKLMRLLLMADGQEVTVADSVAAGLAAVEQAGGKLDLLISDLGLPDGSGHDLMRQLRERGHSIAGIALSGYGAPADIEKSKAAGFSEHLVKPITPDLIAAAIRRAMTSRNLAASGVERRG